MAKVNVENVVIKGWEENLLDCLIRYCSNWTCINNRNDIGKFGCNCREIEIENGRCKEYKLSEKQYRFLE